MTDPSVATVAVTVTPRMLHSLLRAHRMYFNVASGNYKIYDQPSFRFHEPDLAVMRDTSVDLLSLLQELQDKIGAVR